MGSRGVATEQALKRKKSANTSICPGPRDGRDPSAVLDQDDRRLRSFGDAVTDPFYHSLDRDPGRPLQGGEQPGGSLDTVSMTWPMTLGHLPATMAHAGFKFVKGILGGLPPAPP